MNTQSLILAILNFEDATGYEIKKQSTEGAFSFFVDISYGTIYPTLSKLESEGFVVCRSESQVGKPDKKIYSITDKGREEFVKLLDTVPQRDKFKSEFLLVAMCADLCSHEQIEKAIDKQIAETREVYDIVSEISEGCEEPSTLWAANFGKHVKAAALEYLTENRQSLIDVAGSGFKMKDAAE